MKLFVKVVCFTLVALNARADEPKLSAEQAARVAELQAQAAVINADAAVLKAQSELRSAKLSAFSSEIGKDIKGLSGQVSGGDNLDMALYASNRAALKELVVQLCSDLGNTQVFVTNVDVADAVARHATFVSYWDWIETKLSEAKADLEESYQEISTGKTQHAVAAGVSSALFALDATSSVIKGVAGIATLFKTEVSVGEKVDGLITMSEVESELMMQPSCKAADIVFVDEAHLTLESNVSGLMSRSAALRAKLSEVQKSHANLTKIRTDAKSIKALEKANKSGKPSIIARADARLADIEKLETVVETFQNALHAVDSTSGVSPLIAGARNETIYAAIFEDQRKHLRLAVLRSSANSMTKKRLIFNDQVAYAGGVALRVTIGDNDGKRLFDTTYYAQSPWTKVDFKAEGKVDFNNLPRKDGGTPTVPSGKGTVPADKGV